MLVSLNVFIYRNQTYVSCINRLIMKHLLGKSSIFDSMLYVIQVKSKTLLNGLKSISACFCPARDRNSHVRICRLSLTG